jgi:hypothetical protein
LFSADVKSKWLSAHNDFVAGINTVGTCMELVDLFAEGSVNLVIADFGNILLMPRLQAKLKVFKGRNSSLINVFTGKGFYRIFTT